MQLARGPGFRSSFLSLLVMLMCIGNSGICLAEQRDLYILAIGISQYRDPDIEVLQYSDDDAIGMVAWARAQSGYLYTRVHTQVLLNEHATRGAIIDALLSFFENAKPQDQIILFMAGHGLFIPDLGTYHFMAYDSEISRAEATGLEQDDILEKLNSWRLPRKRVMVLVDTCSSGILSNQLEMHAQEPPPHVDEIRVRNSSQDRPVRRNEFVINQSDVDSRSSVWAVFSAGTAQELAQERKGRLPSDPDSVQGHGVFTFSLLEALGTRLSDKDENGIITLTEFQQYVTRRVQELTDGKQIPLMSGRTTDIALSWVPGTVEKCDGQDNDLNGVIDDGFPKDASGLSRCLLTENCNGVDDNGDGRIDEGYDLDGDGHRSKALCGQWGDDCDDALVSVHPLQDDWNNINDDDCDGRVDEDGIKVLWDPTVPDLVEERYRQLSTRTVLSTGASLVLGSAFLGSAIHTLNLYQTLRADGSYEPLEEKRYDQWRRVTGVLGIGSVVSVGLSGQFWWDGHNFHLANYPPQRARLVARD